MNNTSSTTDLSLKVASAVIEMVEVSPRNIEEIISELERRGLLDKDEIVQNIILQKLKGMHEEKLVTIEHAYGQMTVYRAI